MLMLLVLSCLLSTQVYGSQFTLSSPRCMSDETLKKAAQLRVYAQPLRLQPWVAAHIQAQEERNRSLVNATRSTNPLVWLGSHFAPIVKTVTKATGADYLCKHPGLVCACLVPVAVIAVMESKGKR